MTVMFAKQPVYQVYVHETHKIVVAIINIILFLFEYTCKLTIATQKQEKESLNILN